MQSAEDFMKKEERKVQQALVELVNELHREGNKEKSVVKGCLNGIGYPTLARSDSKVVLDFTNEVFLAGKTGVSRIVKKNSKWIKNDFNLPTKEYKGLGSFVYEGVAYVVAGYDKGLFVLNVEDLSERKHVYTTQYHDSVSGFKCIKLVQGKKSQAIVASHSGCGVVLIPLEEMIAKKEIKLREEHFVLKSADGSSMVRMIGHDSVVYISSDTCLRSYDVADGFKQINEQQLPELITSLCTDTKGIVYVGTNDGRIYTNNCDGSGGVVRCFNSGNENGMILRLQTGSYSSDDEQKEGMYYLSSVNRKSGIVYFTDFKNKKVVSPNGFFGSFYDFSAAHDQLFCLGAQSLVLTGKNNLKEEVMTFRDDDINKYKIILGIGGK